MSTQHKPEGQSDSDLEKSVVKYLRDHPDFFEHHHDLLADMVLTHASGNAVSLIERQVSVLREQKTELKRKLQHLMQHARTNEQLSSRFQSLVLDLLDAVTLDDLLETIQSRMISDFDADAVVVRLFRSAGSTAPSSALAQRPEFVDWSEPVLGAFEKIVNARKPICGHLKHGQLDSLFADQLEQIASVALIPLVEGGQSKTCYGMLAIGSRDPQRFHPEMGTMFLEYLANILSRVLKPHLSG
ncbi:MAG TPA: DUF484 family protein [Gammaproteobacteria bacterium]|nr:DUF484 family protein [Gammaproteobacteria bacterium]